MSEPPTSATPTTPPPKEDEAKKAATTPTTPNGTSPKKFEGEGLPFKGKLIGMEDLSVDRDEKVCLDSMFKLKAVVRARGEHKQRIQLNLTMSAVKVIDDTTKAQIASHEIERISFVVIDPRDNRAFGYIYNTSDDRHQFWAIKTEKSAAATVLALKELFELAFEQYTNAEKSKAEANKPTSSPSSPPESTVPTQEQPPAVSIPLPSPPPPPPETVAPTAAPSLLDEIIWDEPPSNPVTQSTQNRQEDPISIWGLDVPTAPVVQSAPPANNLLVGLFDDFPSTQQPTSTDTNNSLFNPFPNTTPAPVPPPSNPYSNFLPQQTPPVLFRGAPSVPQQQPVFPTTLPPFQQQPQQQDLLGSGSFSPVAPPSVTSPFAGLDLLGDLSLTTANKPTKESFFPAAPPQKTMQQLLAEKKT